MFGPVTAPSLVPNLFDGLVAFPAVDTFLYRLAKFDQLARIFLILADQVTDIVAGIAILPFGKTFIDERFLIGIE